MKINIKKWLYEDFIKKMIKNSATLFTGSFLGSTLGLFSFAVIIRALGSELYGQFVLIEGYMGIFNQLFNFQCWQALIKFGSEALHNNDILEFKRYIKIGFYFDLFSAALGAIVGFSLVNIIGEVMGYNSQQILYTRIMSLLIVFNIMGTPIGVLRLLKQFKIISIQKVAISLAKLFLVTLAWLLKVEQLHFIYLLIVIQFLDYLSLLLVAFIFMKKEGLIDFLKVSIRDWKQFVKFAFWTNIESSINIPKRQLDKFFIAKFLSYQSLSAFNMFKKFSLIIKKIVSSIYFSIFPDLSKLIAGGERKEAIKKGFKVGIIILALGSPFYLLFCLASYWLVGPIFGDEFVSYYWLLILYVGYNYLAVVFISVDPIFISLGFVKSKVVINIIANIVFLGVVVLIRGKLDLLGFIIADIVQMVLINVSKIWVIYTEEYRKERLLRMREKGRL